MNIDKSMINYFAFHFLSAPLTDFVTNISESVPAFFDCQAFLGLAFTSPNSLPKIAITGKIVF